MKARHCRNNYVYFDLTCIGWPWTCNSVEVTKFSPRVQAPFSSCTPYVVTNAYNKICICKYQGWVSSFLAKHEYELRIKTPLNWSFCAVTADSTSRWPHSKKAHFHSVWRQGCNTRQQVHRSSPFAPPWLPRVSMIGTWCKYLSNSTDVSLS